MNELKPCPFCGEIPQFLKPSGTVSCGKCLIAILPEIWNTRPREEELEKRIAELEREIYVLVEELHSIDRQTD